MMEKKIVDRRVQRTRQLLQDAMVALILEKGYEAVTVQDVIDRANVGRSTFYSHFQDKESLFLSEFEAMRTQFEKFLMGQTVTDESPWGLSLMMFQHAQNQRQLYKALVGKQGGNIAFANIQKYLTGMLNDHLEPQFKGKKNVKIPPEIMAHYLVSSFMSLLTWWLDHDLPYTANQINDMYRQVTQPGVEAIIKEN